MLEAMALNTPVVATDCPGGVREIVAGWFNCRLARPEDPASLARRLLNLCRSKPHPLALSPTCCFNQTLLSHAVGAYEKLLFS